MQLEIFEELYDMKTQITAVWFKKDLRIEDHRPLFEAAAEGRVIPVFIDEDDFWKQAANSPRQRQFMLSSLADLKRSLQESGSDLLYFRSDVISALNRLKVDYGINAIYSHEETGIDWTFKRDKSVAKWCNSEGVIWREFQCNGVVRRLKTRDGWAALRDKFIETYDILL